MSALTVLQTNGSEKSGRSHQDLLQMGSKFRRKAVLLWPRGRPQRVLIVKKPGVNETSAMLAKIAAWCEPTPDIQAACQVVHRLKEMEILVLNRGYLPDTIGDRVRALHSYMQYPHGEVRSPPR